MDAPAKKSWVSETLLLAATPIAAHSLSYFYEMGFCRYFGLPLDFATINLTSIFISITVLLGTAWTLWGYINFASLFFENMVHSAIGRIFLNVAHLVLLLFSQMLIFGTDWIEWWWAAFLLWFFGSAAILTPLVGHRDKKSFREKVEAQEAIDASVPTLNDKIVQKDYGFGIAIVYCVLFLFICSYSAGRAAAKSQNYFLIIEGKPTLAVLRIYGDKMFCAPVDKTAQTVKREFYIRKWDDEKLVLKSERIGHLTVEPEDIVSQFLPHWPFQGQ